MVDETILDRLCGLALRVSAGAVPQSTSMTTGVAAEIMKIVKDYEQKRIQK